MEVTIKMINIPLNALGVQQNEFLKNHPNRREMNLERMRAEGEDIFSRTVTIVVPDLDMSTRKSFLTNPRKVAVTIDFRTMGFPEYGQDDRDWTGGVYAQNLQPNPRLLHEIHYGQGILNRFFPIMAPRPGPHNEIDFETRVCLRSLDVVDEMTPGPDPQPLENEDQVLERVDAQRDYVARHMDIKQRDRTPYHIRNFHELPEPVHGHEVRPLLRRVPSNESLRRLLPDAVTNEINRYNPRPGTLDPIVRQLGTDHPRIDRRLGPSMTVPMPIHPIRRNQVREDEADRHDQLIEIFRQMTSAMARWVHQSFFNDRYLYTDMRNQYEYPTVELMQSFDLNPRERHRRADGTHPDDAQEENEEEDEDSWSL